MLNLPPLDPPGRGPGARVDPARGQTSARAGHPDCLPEQEQDGCRLPANEGTPGVGGASERQAGAAGPENGGAASTCLWTPYTSYTPYSYPGGELPVPAGAPGAYQTPARATSEGGGPV